MDIDIDGLGKRTYLALDGATTSEKPGAVETPQSLVSIADQQNGKPPRLKHETIAEALVRTNGRPSGFDYLRIMLAVSVVTWHSVVLTTGPSNPFAWWTPFVNLILPMFFALSGFLVSGSAQRCKTLREFLMLRAIRILPALAVETILSIVLLGSVFTSLSLRRYFTSHDTITYALNIVGYIHFYLPGVFSKNPWTFVNRSLWTIPFELECYLLVSALWLANLLRNRAVLLIVMAIIAAIFPLFDLVHGELVPITFNVPGRALVTSFAAGMLLYIYRDKVVLRPMFLIGATALSVACVYGSASCYFAGIPAAYCIAYLGIRDPYRVPIIFVGDYSYGIYVYSMPVQQALIALFPGLCFWWFNLPAGLALSSLWAAFSWRFIEKPVLERRKQLVALIQPKSKIEPDGKGETPAALIGPENIVTSS